MHKSRINNCTAAIHKSRSSTCTVAIHESRRISTSSVAIMYMSVAMFGDFNINYLNDKEIKPLKISMDS